MKYLDHTGSHAKIQPGDLEILLLKMIAEGGGAHQLKVNATVRNQVAVILKLVGLVLLI